MSLADPLSITISGVTTSLPRVSVGDDRSEYQSGDGLIRVTASHQGGAGKRIRRMYRLDTSKLTADPFKPAENVQVGMAVYTVFDLPPAGYTAAEALAAFVGYKGLYGASDANIVKILGGES